MSKGIWKAHGYIKKEVRPTYTRYYYNPAEDLNFKEPEYEHSDDPIINDMRRSAAIVRDLQKRKSISKAINGVKSKSFDSLARLGKDYVDEKMKETTSLTIKRLE